MGVAENILKIREKIAAAARRAGRHPGEIRLMAVTKTVPDDRVREAISAGVDLLGENYVQEARGKIEKLGRVVPWHFTGHLQTNKAKYAVSLFEMIHSVDRIELASELNRRAEAAGRVLPVLIEVNIGGEESKSGVAFPAAKELIRQAAKLSSLRIKGLMTMPPWQADPEEVRPCFIALRRLKEEVTEENIGNVRLEELSMGMSGDFEAAVEEGATIVRIGRGIFGERQG